jgi:hypothetical protein
MPQVHIQSKEDNTWVIRHKYQTFNLSVVVLDSDRKRIENHDYELTYHDEHTVILEFEQPMLGCALIDKVTSFLD